MRIFFFLLTCFGVIIYPTYVNASISLSATRVIYESKQKDASINVVNNGNKEVLIQSWLAQEDNNNPPPFAVTPPLVKMKGGQHQLLRVLYQGHSLPQDKESVFWLNVQEIPQQVEGDNQLQLALRQRVKLFYRPAGLSGTANLASTQLNVTVRGNKLEFYNPTPYYINMLWFRQGNLTLKGKMIAPRDSLTIDSPGIRSTGEFDITVINDFGGQTIFNGKLINGLSAGMRGNK
jgi:P pilus assembly chaperone PapD